VSYDDIKFREKYRGVNQFIQLSKIEYTESGDFKKYLDEYYDNDPGKPIP